MKSTRALGSGVVVVAIALTVAALAYAYAQSSVGSQTAAASTAEEAVPGSGLEVEAEIARTDLLDEMRAALGGAYGGAWFNGATTQLHVGVVWPAARQTAEAVAAQAGLADHVTETPVHSTWEQLQAAQERWSQRLADLSARAEVATAWSIP